jgi:hypothetical protein
MDTSALSRRNTTKDNKHKLLLFPNNPDFHRAQQERERTFVLDTKQ